MPLRQYVRTYLYDVSYAHFLLRAAACQKRAEELSFYSIPRSSRDSPGGSYP